MMLSGNTISSMIKLSVIITFCSVLLFRSLRILSIKVVPSTLPNLLEDVYNSDIAKICECFAVRYNREIYYHTRPFPNQPIMHIRGTPDPF